MKKFLGIPLLCLLLLGAFLAGSWFHQHQSTRPVGETKDRRILHYVDPMDPSHISKEPGIAPCGMPMEPVYAEEDGQISAIDRSATPGTVLVNQQKQQRIGVTTGKIERTAITHPLRALGRVTANENKTYAIFAATDGWMSEVHESTTGSIVRKDQLMAQIKVYDYDFFTWQQRYLTDMGSTGRRPVFSVFPGQAQMDGSGARRPANMPAGKMTTPQPPKTPAAMKAPESEPEASAAPVWGIPPGADSYGSEEPAAAVDHAAMDHSPPPPKQPEKVPPAAASAPLTTPAGQPKANMGHEMEPSTSVQPGSALLKPQREDEILYASKSRLYLLDIGMSDTQMRELSRSGIYATRLDLRSPVDGLVLSRNVSPRQWIARGTECFRIADLRKVWIEADIYESEAQYIRPGMQAMVTMPGLGQHYAATVSEVPSRFDAATRTLKVRLEMDNPELMFRPGMFVDVDFRLELPAAKTVATSAVIDTGVRKIVYVALGEGIFEPREIRTGWSFGDRIEVVDGLKDGESVVVSGKFLIDSESRMQLAAMRLMDGPDTTPAGGDPSSVPQRQPTASQAGPVAPMPASVKPPPDEIDPVCGMKVTDFDQARADDLLMEYQGKTYWFCSADCKEQFERNPPGFLDKAGMSRAQQPETHMHSSPQMQMGASESPPAPSAPLGDSHADHAASMPMPGQVPAEARGAETDPVCGMKVTDLDQARADGLMTEYQGTTYWFCSADCKEQFERNPQGFLDKAGQSAPSQETMDHSGHGHD